MVSERSKRREAVRIEAKTHRAGLADAHRRFGGVDVGAVIAGAFAATGITVVLGGLAAGTGRVVYVNGLQGAPAATAGSVIAGIGVLVVAFVGGGWVAGRMARYDGARNGALTALCFVAFAGASAAIGAVVGDSYNVFAGQHLPQWFTHNARTATAAASAIVALILMVLAGLIGGKIGDRYHHRIDEVIASNVDGGLGSEPRRDAEPAAGRHRQTAVVAGRAGAEPLASAPGAEGRTGAEGRRYDADHKGQIR